MTTRMEEGFNRVRSAVKEAVSNVAGIAGKSDDPDVIFYDSLKPEDFEAIMRDHGFDMTMSYIQDMESRKARKKG